MRQSLIFVLVVGFLLAMAGNGFAAPRVVLAEMQTSVG